MKNFSYKLEKYEFKMRNSNKNFYRQKFNFYKKLVGGMNSIDSKYIETLDEFIKKHNEANPLPSKQFIDESHGLNHMLTVLCHATQALEAWEGNPIDPKEVLKVKLAALLHDIDDSKYFPSSVNYQNARHILLVSSSSSNDINSDDIEDIIKMISWVSSSKNGDRIPEGVSDLNNYLLYPRYADRLEAIGIIGLERTLEYTKKVKGVLFTPTTPKATDETELFTQIATKERYESYSQASKSMIDHFYDKLLRIGVFPISNIYFQTICKQRQQPLIDIVLYFGSNPDITEEQLEKKMLKYIEQSKTSSSDGPQTSCMCGSKCLK